MSITPSSAQDYFQSKYGSQAPWVMEAWERNNRSDIRERRAAKSESALANLIPLGRTKNVQEGMRHPVAPTPKIIASKIKKPGPKKFQSDRMQKIYREFVSNRSSIPCGQ